MHGKRADTIYLTSHFRHFSRIVLLSISKCVKSVRRFNGMRSFVVNSTKEVREQCSMWRKNLINTNMRESVGQVTTPPAYIIIRQAKQL
jgi:hypothetical protein